MSFFQNLCPASFPPVTETRPERFKNRQNSSLYLVRYRIKLSHYQASELVFVCVCVCVFFGCTNSLWYIVSTCRVQLDVNLLIWRADTILYRVLEHPRSLVSMEGWGFLDSKLHRY